MIREATQDDRESVLEMGMRFAADTQYAEFIHTNRRVMSETFEGVMASKDGTVLVQELDGALVGMILMVIYAHPFSGERVASELAWWVDPEARRSGAGVRLLRAAEKWAAEHGAAAIQMIAPNVEIGTLYGRLGYRPMETAFQRSL
jgi:GNAT superfamily N-acetyltransferase